MQVRTVRFHILPIKFLKIWQLCSRMYEKTPSAVSAGKPCWESKSEICTKYLKNSHPIWWSFSLSNESKRGKESNFWTKTYVKKQLHILHHFMTGSLINPLKFLWIWVYIRSIIFENMFIHKCVGTYIHFISLSHLYV